MDYGFSISHGRTDSTLVLVIALVGCGGSGGGGSAPAVPTPTPNPTPVPVVATLSGVAQKGPFETAAEVTFRAVDGGGSVGEVSGSTTTFDSSGACSAELETGTYLVQVSGTYFDELSGTTSASAATLTSLQNLDGSGSIANVNLLTHIVATRTIALVASSGSVAAARTQAETELSTSLGTLGIDLNGTSTEELDLYDPENGGSLIAVSTLLLSIAERRAQSADQLVEDVVANL